MRRLGALVLTGLLLAIAGCGGGGGGDLREAGEAVLQAVVVPDGWELTDRTFDGAGPRFPYDQWRWEWRTDTTAQQARGVFAEAVAAAGWRQDGDTVFYTSEYWLKVFASDVDCDGQDCARLTATVVNGGRPASW